MLEIDVKALTDTLDAEIDNDFDAFISSNKYGGYLYFE